MLGPAQLLPAGIAGEAVRIYELSEQVGVATSSAAVALARLNSTLALATWALVGAILLDGSIGPLATAICGLSFFLIAVVWSISFWPRTVVDRVVLWLENRHNALIDKVIPFIRALQDMGGNHYAFCLSLLSSLIGWGINFSALSAFAFSISLTIMPTVFATALQLSLLATLIPFTMNGFGLREGILLNVLMKAGIPSSHAAIIAILVDLQLLPFVLISAAAWMLTRKAQPPQTS